VREQKRVLIGRVISDKMEKTVVVAVQSLRRHRLYQRTVRRTKNYMAHNAENEAHLGDLVRIQESRPISRHKHWRVLAVLEAAAQRGKAVAVPQVELVVAPEVQEETAPPDAGAAPEEGGAAEATPERADADEGTPQ
jgi:small subunit ribosomal protein S17